MTGTQPTAPRPPRVPRGQELLSKSAYSSGFAQPDNAIIGPNPVACQRLRVWGVLVFGSGVQWPSRL